MNHPLRVLAALFWFASCATWSHPSYAVVVERIVAIINDDVITLSELDDAIDLAVGDKLEALSTADLKRAKREELRRSFLDQMINERILSQHYTKLDLSVSEAEVDSAIDLIARQNNMSRDVLRNELLRQGIPYLEYRDQIRRHLLQNKLIDKVIRTRVHITEDDLKAAYAEMKAAQEGKEKAEITGIRVAGGVGSSPGAAAAARRAAEKARRLLMEGLGADEVAARFPDGSVISLGEMGSFRPGELMEPLNSAVFKLKAGEVSPVIERAQDIYVLKVLSYSADESTQTYEDVRDQLYQRVYEEEIDRQLKNFVKKAREEAHVRILL